MQYFDKGAFVKVDKGVAIQLVTADDHRTHCLSRFLSLSREQKFAESGSGHLRSLSRERERDREQPLHLPLHEDLDLPAVAAGTQPL